MSDRAFTWKNSFLSFVTIIIFDARFSSANKKKFSRTKNNKKKKLYCSSLACDTWISRNLKKEGKSFNSTAHTKWFSFTKQFLANGCRRASSEKLFSLRARLWMMFRCWKLLWIIFSEAIGNVCVKFFLKLASSSFKNFLPNFQWN